MSLKNLTCYLFLIPCICYSQTGSFEYQGNVRDYIVHLPVGYIQGSHVPLVINLHGLTSNASQQQSYTEFDKIADTANFIVVYPNGMPSPYGGNGWNAGIGINPTIDDVGFISVLIDTLYKKYGINLKRVYATGMSNGGFLSQRMGCELSNKIAAIASVSGTIGISTSAFKCSPSGIVPVMHIHGTNDNIVNYNGSTFGTSVDSTINFWLKHNGCPISPVITQFPDNNTSDGSTVTKYYYGLCLDASEVVLLKVNNGAHKWPGSPLGGTGTNMDIKASCEIWNFFYKHTLDEQNSVDESPVSLSPEPVTFYPNPCYNGNITVKPNISTVLRIIIINLMGEKVYEIPVTGNTDEIIVPTQLFKKGIYILQAETNCRVFSYKFNKL